MRNEYSQFESYIGLEPYDATEIEQFHESTKVMPSTALTRDLRIGAYLYDPRCILEASRNYKLYQTCPKVDLPKAMPIKVGFDDLLNTRISTRSYSGEPISLEELATVLHSLRVTRVGYSEEVESVTMRQRAYPSPGGLYPVEVYLLVMNVQGLEKGVYHFDVIENQLSFLRELPPRDELKMIVGDHDDICIDTASVAMIMSGVLPRSTVKYEGLGYRFALIEAGIVGEHLSLAATGLNLGNLFWGSYYDDMVHDLLGLDGVEEVALNFMWLGNN